MSETLRTVAVGRIRRGALQAGDRLASGESIRPVIEAATYRTARDDTKLTPSLEGGKLVINPKHAIAPWVV